MEAQNLPRKGPFSDSSIMPSALDQSTSAGLGLDDDESMLTDDDVGFSKSSTVSRQHSTAPGTTDVETKHGQSESPARDQRSPDSDSITVAQTNWQLPIDPQERNGKLKNKYMLSDGTVVNGKGLGRGRPGFKRGPRKSALSAEVIADSSESATISTTSPASISRSTSIKRKRADSDYKEDLDDEDDDFDDVASRDSTPEYNPTASTLTRSGRQSQKPAPIVTTSTPTAPNSAKRPTLMLSTSSPSVKKHPKIKVKVYRGREQFALCEHCLRGNGPPGNDIVFCDACNRCWHQRCHEPRVTKEMIADTKAEWFCAECDKILHGKKRGRPSNKPAVPQFIPPPPQPQLPPDLPRIKYGMPFIPGMTLTLAQKKDYLHSLPKERLIDIVLRAAELAPNMPIFETPYHLVSHPTNLPFQNGTSPLGPPPPGPISRTSSAHTTPQPQLPIPPPPVLPPKSNVPLYDHPTASVTSKPNTQPPPSNLTEEDEGYYDDYDELALLYPKPGQGVYDLALPPESMDLGILLEGPDCKTFSHWAKGQGENRKTLESAK